MLIWYHWLFPGGKNKHRNQFKNDASMVMANFLYLLSSEWFKKVVNLHWGQDFAKGDGGGGVQGGGKHHIE
jgi:hypothetical protein